MNTRTLQQALKELAADGSSLVHPTYGYLERKTRIAGLSILQWAQIVGSLGLAWLLSAVLPLPSPYNLSVGLTVAGTPPAVLLVAVDADLSLVAYLRGLVRARRRRGAYLPGTPPAQPATGYVVDDDSAQPEAATPAVVTPTPLEDLWR